MRMSVHAFVCIGKRRGRPSSFPPPSLGPFHLPCLPPSGSVAAGGLVARSQAVTAGWKCAHAHGGTWPARATALMNLWVHRVCGPAARRAAGGETRRMRGHVEVAAPSAARISDWRRWEIVRGAHHALLLSLVQILRAKGRHAVGEASVQSENIVGWKSNYNKMKTMCVET